MNSNEQNKNKITTAKNKLSFNDKQNLVENLMREKKGKALPNTNTNSQKEEKKLAQNKEEKKKVEKPENKTLDNKTKNNKNDDDGFEDLDDEIIKDIIEQEKKKEKISMMILLI